MSLYESSVRSSTWSFVSRRFTRPFTTLEGWREIGVGVYAMNSSFRMFSLNHQFDPEQFRDEDPASRTLPTYLRDAPPVPDIRNIQIDEKLMKPLKSAKKVEVSPKFAPKIASHSKREKRREAWDEVLPELFRKEVIDAPQREQPYHIFSRRKKWLLVILVGTAGTLPGATPYMYLPALGTTSQDFQMGLAEVTTTITIYFFFQGIASLIWVPLSDSIGRRPVYISAFIIYIAASIVLSFSPNFAVLLVFRGLQALGIASTVSIGSSVIQDLCGKSERDEFLNFYQAIRNITFVIAPVIGGLLSNFLSFRSSFVLLLSISAAIFIQIILFFPETLRSIAGNGSVRLTGVHEPLVEKVGVVEKPDVGDDGSELDLPPKLSIHRCCEPFSLTREKDILLSLIFGSVVFAAWMMVTVSTTGLFRKAFRLNDLLLGVSFIPNAVGCIVGSTLMGNILNHDFVYASSTYRASNSLAPSSMICTKDLPADFPLEHTRLRHLPCLLPAFVITLCGYGFTLTYPSVIQRPGWILFPLFLQFVIAATANAICAIHQTLVADLWHQSGHASMAASNLVKCMVAALGVGMIQLMLNGIGTWSTFVALGMVVMVLVPLPVALWYWGLDWRAEREARREILERVSRA